MREHTPEDRKGSRGLLVETVPGCAWQTLKVLERS